MSGTGAAFLPTVPCTVGYGYASTVPCPLLTYTMPLCYYVITTRSPVLRWGMLLPGPYVGPRSAPPRVPPSEPQVSAALWVASAEYLAEFERKASA
eukprot:3002055-Rhodomonas_salina.1